MGEKFAQSRSSEISEEERQAALAAMAAFDKLLKQLKAARAKDQDVVDVLKENKEASPRDLFKIRHLLRDFQKDVKDQYTRIILDFAGQKDANMQTMTKGYIHLLQPLEKDTATRQLKAALQDAMQQLTEFLEEFLESFEHFGSPEQITDILTSSQKADKIIQSIENIVDKQLKPHFQKNILVRKTVVSSMRGNIKKRARLVRLLEA